MWGLKLTGRPGTPIHFELPQGEKRVAEDVVDDHKFMTETVEGGADI